MAEKSNNSGGAVSGLFREELRRARNQAGLTQDGLASKVSYSPALVAAIETGRRIPSADFAARCDEVFGIGGLLSRIQARLLEETGQSWLAEWAGIEREAVILRSWEPLLIPGLLQTEEYAQAVLATAPGATEDQVTQRVAKRLVRQKILERDSPPMLFILVDEGALWREIGGPLVMKGQMEKLLEMAARPKVSLQVVPASAGAHPGLSGPLVIARFKSGHDVAYIDTALTGQLVERH
jgi:transcriptional regulator with XRE-family HTH domain